MTGFNAVLGIYLFNGFKGEKDANKNRGRKGYTCYIEK